MGWRDNALVRPALGAVRAVRLAAERVLTPGLRREVESLRQQQAASAAALARLESTVLTRLEHAMTTQAGALARLTRQVGAVDAFARATSRRSLAQDHPHEVWLATLRTVGVLNYENSIVSGEELFLERYAARWPRAVVLDIGANEGQFAELCRACGPEAVIHSIEPHPRAHAVLAGKAGALGITAHCLAISDAAGEAEFFDYADEQGSQHASLYRAVIEDVHGRPASALRVPCATLDSFLARHGLDRVGLLKIDTEGHELAVLRGAHGALARGSIDVIQFEFNEMNVISRVFMKDFFDILPGYRLFRLLPRGAMELERYDPCSMEIFAFQNIVAVRRDLDAGWVTATEPP